MWTGKWITGTLPEYDLPHLILIINDMQAGKSLAFHWNAKYSDDECLQYLHLEWAFRQPPPKKNNESTVSGMNPSACLHVEVTWPPRVDLTAVW